MADFWNLENCHSINLTLNLSVVIIPWLSPQDDVLMDYCMLYLSYTTDVMIVRYGIQDLLNMPRMREMSTELGALLRKYCPSYSAVICHSIQGVKTLGIIFQRKPCSCYHVSYVTGKF